MCLTCVYVVFDTVSRQSQRVLVLLLSSEQAGESQTRWNRFETTGLKN